MQKSLGSYENGKTRKFTTKKKNKIRLNCDCFDESFVNDTRKSISCCFRLDSHQIRKQLKLPEIKH